MCGYIYLTENLVNHKKYIGKRSKDFYKDTGYLGSGTLIKKATKKYGSKNFSKELIEECSSLEELNEREEYWIKFYNAVEDPMFYNLSPKANGSAKGSKRSEDTKKSISKAKSGVPKSEEHKMKISKTISGRIWINNGIEEKQVDPEDYKLNYPTWNTGRILDMSGENHPMYGKHFSEEARNRMSESAKGKVVSDETRKNMSKAKKGTVIVTDGVIEHQIDPSLFDYYISLGFHEGLSDSHKESLSNSCKGKKQPEHQKEAVSKALKGIKRVTNGIVNKIARTQEEFDMYLNSGFTNGQTRNSKKMI